MATPATRRHPGKEVLWKGDLVTFDVIGCFALLLLLCLMNDDFYLCNVVKKL